MEIFCELARPEGQKILPRTLDEAKRQHCRAAGGINIPPACLTASGVFKVVLIFAGHVVSALLQMKLWHAPWADCQIDGAACQSNL